MFARVLTALCLLQAALIYVPPLSWPMWMLHFGAIEACVLGAVLGLVGLATTSERIVQGLAIIGIVASLGPAIAAVPAYLREGVSFSPVAWITGGRVADVPVERDVPLGPLVADVWRGAGAGPRPAVVVVHGGSWWVGDKGEVPHVSAALAQAGFTVFDVRYRLEPFPAGIEDVRCALATIRASSAEWGVDPDRVALLGRSAGAEIALIAAYADASIPSACGGEPAPVRAVVSLYGPTDLAWAHAHPYVPDVVDGVAALEVYLGGPPEAQPERYRAATPQRWARPGLPPTLLVHGTGERCVRPENMEKLRLALDAAGAPVQTLAVPLADHGFDVRPGGFGEQLSRAVILRFLRERIGG